ncbi:MAG: 6,7-dimethyl-8-ribityllumazine synthase, partial [Bacteroidia bacterium]|nr:6,7-dimethyl-8-ribityllumazine synthase [Bacteroidia bacterium]
MTSEQKHVFTFNPADFPSVSSLKIGIVVSEWNKEITEAMFRGAKETLLSSGIKKENIFRSYVPGSFELPLGALRNFEKNRCDAVICIGCVIRGYTPHFDFICSAVSNGIMDLNLKHKTP